MVTVVDILKRHRGTAQMTYSSANKSTYKWKFISKKKTPQIPARANLGPELTNIIAFMQQLDFLHNLPTL